MKGNSHINIINNKKVKEYLENCAIPANVQNVKLNERLVHNIEFPEKNSILNIVAVQGEYTTIPVKKSFPSSQITFFQFGALLMQHSDLVSLNEEPFLGPEDMNMLKKIERDELVLPTKNVSVKSNQTLKNAVRSAIYDFFAQKDENSSSLLNTLYWFLFEEYNSATTKTTHQLSQCPHCEEPRIPLEKNKMDSDYQWKCTHCDGNLLITDVFRLYEDVNDDSGAGGILAYTNSLIENFIAIHIIKSILEIEEGLINKFLLIKNGPLSFIGRTANMHKPMRTLLNFLREKNTINFVGIEKSGAFVEHAKEISNLLEPGQVFLFDNAHIYKYIIPGNPESDTYASTSYYGGKVVFKSKEERVYVLTFPVESHEFYSSPELNDIQNVQEILMNIELLKSDISQVGLIPVAIASKLVSLTNRPSVKILQKFAQNTLGND